MKRILKSNGRHIPTSLGIHHIECHHNRRATSDHGVGFGSLKSLDSCAKYKEKHENTLYASYIPYFSRNTLGEPVASGVYFYTLTAGEFTATRKLLIRK